MVRFSQPEHHTKLENLVLETVGVGCVSQFPLDYMHVVCLGVVKHMVKTWIKLKNQDYSLNGDQVSLISRRNSKVAKDFPSEFNRVPRILDEIDRWKASEFRSFLLYSSIVVLKNILNSRAYKNFLKLHIAIRILSDSSICNEFNNYAENLLLEFVVELEQIYGKIFLTYNVHSLLHLAKDVSNYGKLDNFSAFKYENYLYQLKKKVKNGKNILSQLSNRLVEQSIILKEKTNNINMPVLKHPFGENLYKCVITQHGKHSTKHPNNLIEYCKNIYIIRKVKKTNKVINLDMFFDIDQALCIALGIFQTQSETYCDNDIEISISDITRKYMKLSVDLLTVFLPLL